MAKYVQLLFVFAALGLCGAVLPAQLTVTVGDTVNTSNNFPFNFSSQGRYQSPYTAAEMSGIPSGAMLTEIRVFGTSGFTPTYGGFELRVGHTTLAPLSLGTTFANNYSGPVTTCIGPTTFTANLTMPTTTALVKYRFPFTTPFVWNGTDGILLDFIYLSKTGTGWLVATTTGRNRTYDFNNGSATVAVSNLTDGNWGVEFVFLPPGNGVLLSNSGPGATPLVSTTPQTDKVFMDMTALAFGAASAINSIAFSNIGTVPDSAFSSVKLVRDENNNGIVEGTDTILGTGVFASGTVTFSGTPLQAVPLSPSPRLLLAVSYAGPLTVSSTVQFSIVSSAAITWTNGPDLSGYPINSGSWLVVPPAMQGNYTIAQTGGDFASLGAAFDALEATGVTAAVTLTFTDSATYPSDISHTLGINATGTAVAVAGVSATNTITIRAAPGQRPKIQGNATGANLQTPLTGRGCIGIMTSWVTVDGIECFGGPHFGIIIQGNNTGLRPENNTIRRCIVHDIPDGPGIAYMGQNASYFTNGVIENNFVWNCFTNSVSTSGVILVNTVGAITVRNPASGASTVRHNTVLHTSAFATTGGIAVNYSSSQFGLNDCSNNIVICTNASVPAIFLQTTTLAPVAANCDRNYWFATTHCNQATLTPFSTWQTGGRDVTGSNADPQLISTTAPIDLHLQTTSPCVDAASATSLTTDVDGDVRPQGTANDIGGDEAILGPPPDMNVQLNAVVISDGGSTNVNDVPLAGLPFTFVIENLGAGNLLLFGAPTVQITLGTNCTAGTVVQTQPANTTVGPFGGLESFTVYIEPAAVGAFDFTISIINNNPGKNPYDFMVTGNGIPNNAAAMADPAVGSAFSGPTNGPFAVSVDPGFTLANAQVLLSDPEADPITVTSINPVGNSPTGIVAPAIPGAAHPVTLSWTGAADGTNPPGAYSWDVTFADSVNGTPVVATVTIIINDVAPIHTIANALSGDGSAGTPYTGEFTQGDTGAVTIDLASVSDANTGQLLNLGVITPGAGNPAGGVGFQFSLTGVLTIAPAGALAAADAGTHSFAVEVTDGTNTTIINVSILVFGTSGSITFATASPLPDGVVNVTYTQAITIAGAVGAVVFNLQSGNLPSGLTMDAAGTITGVPLVTGPATFTVRVVDSTNDTATQTYQLTINNPAPPPSDGGSSGSGSGGSCSAGSGANLLGLLACVALGLTWTRRRRA